MQEIIESLNRYVNDRIAPGSFLLKVLENDLMGAFNRADDVNIERMHDIVKYVYNNVPLQACGSKERVAAWLAED